MTNYMAEVAKLLGVEIGEEFEIQTTKQGCMTAIITEEDIFVPKASDTVSEYNKSIVLRNLLRGKFTIKHSFWKPDYHLPFWYIAKNNNAYCELWEGTTFNLMLYRLGNFYKSKVEAEANRDKWASFYESDEVLEV